MYGFGVVSFIHDIARGFSDSLTLSEQWCRMVDIVYGVLGDLDAQDHLLVGIHCDRGLQEALSCFSGSPGVIVTGVGTGEPGCIDGGDGYYLTPGIKECQSLLEHSREEERRNPGHELMNS